MLNSADPESEVVVGEEPTEFLPPVFMDEALYEDYDLIARLVRAWLNERNAPEIIPFQFDLIADILELLDNQVTVHK